LKPGQEVTVGRYTLRHDALKVAEDDQKQMVTAYISVFEGGKQIDTLYPSKWFYRKHEGQPTTETAIRRRPSEDLYVVLAKPEIESQTAFLEIHVNPLVNWVWFGFGVIAIGTGIALLPERAFSFALAKMPADAATTTAALLLAVLLSATTLAAQSGSGAEKVQVANIKPLERQMQGEILCMCGGCKSPLNDCPMLYCHMREPEKAILHDLVEQGRTRDQIVASFIQRYGGQDVLGAPLDQGFNRLAWLFPYLVGAGSAISVGFVAVRLARRNQSSADAADAREADAALEQRLDDELRDLD
jgi:cytochrome c-type biogenesis protein CcmF